MGQWHRGMTEAELQEQIRSLVRTAGMLIYHPYDSRHSYSGFPDLVIVGRGGILHRELKRDGEYPTPAQRSWIRALTEAGADVDVWRPADWPDRITAEVLALRRPRSTDYEGVGGHA